MTDEVLETVIALIAEQKALPAASISGASTFDELNMDSLDRISLSFEVEERFHISIPDDALNSLRTVADVVAGVRQLQGKKSPA